MSASACCHAGVVPGAASAVAGVTVTWASLSPRSRTGSTRALRAYRDTRPPGCDAAPVRRSHEESWSLVAASVPGRR